MQVSVLSTKEKFEAANFATDSIQFFVTESYESFMNSEADIYLALMDNAAGADYSSIKKPVVINSVIKTVNELQNQTICRINGWDSFINRNVWEAAGNISLELRSFFAAANKKLITLEDVPGLVSARIIAMIINEAYFALQAGVSTKDEIDTAMKLGTNYPYGPFEWAQKIGIKNISQLLNKMWQEDAKYIPCELLVKEANGA